VEALERIALVLEWPYREELEHIGAETEMQEAKDREVTRKIHEDD
jgi:hypothetical protein